MKIGFLVLRDTFLKTMGSLIDACLRRGDTVIVFYDEAASSSGSKAYQRVISEKLHDLISRGAIPINFTLTDFARTVKKAQVDVLVTHEGFYTLRTQLEELTRLRQAGMKVVSLCHFFEISAQPLEALTFFDKTYYLSEYARNLHFQLQMPAKYRHQALLEYRDLYEITGSPMFDQVASLDPKASKKEIGLPAEKRAVLLFAPVLTQVTNWRFYVWRERDRRERIARVIRDKKWRLLGEAVFTPSFFDILNAIKDFCNRNDALLIVKSRPKQNDPDYFSSMADRYFDGSEDIYYPVFSSYKLISAADLCIGVMSMGAVEAVAQSKPTANIYIPPSVDYPANYVTLPADRRAYLEAISSKEMAGPFNSPSSLVHLERSEVIPWLQDLDIADLTIDPKAFSDYRQRLLGISETPSSIRILDSLIALVD